MSRLVERDTQESLDLGEAVIERLPPDAQQPGCRRLRLRRREGAVNVVNMAIYVLASLLAWIAAEVEFGVPPVLSVLIAAVLSFAAGRVGQRRITA